MASKLPNSIIADTLNSKLPNIGRDDYRSDSLPKVHVSSLIKTGSYDKFCPREFVLRYLESRSAVSGGVPPAVSLLWGIGHFYGDYIVKQFIKRNPSWGAYAWGDWTCQCGTTSVTRRTFADASEESCANCGGALTNYVETDLFDPKKRVVGHADLIFLVDGVFYVYEFKSIERADMSFDSITEPLQPHLLQASHYYYMLRAEGKTVSRQIRFVYIDRSMSDLFTKKPYKELKADAVSAERISMLYNNVDAIHKAFTERRLPRRVCESINDPRATNCDRAVSCFYRKKTTIKIQS